MAEATSKNGSDWTADRRSGIAVHRVSGLRLDRASGSTVEYRNGLLVAHLRGTPYQRGLAHGRLLRGEILRSGIAPYFSGFVAELYSSSRAAAGLPTFLRRRIGDLLEWWYYRPLEKQMLEETRAELAGVAEATGLDLRDVLRGSLAPDVMEQLAAGFLHGGKQALGNYYLGGCSAVYVRGQALKRRRPALFARNLDFPGALVWKHPLLVFSHPEEQVVLPVLDSNGGLRRERKKKQPYLTVSAAGFPGFGLTGLNASGICFGTFVCLSKNVSRTGVPSLDFNHYLFTRAESLEALRVLLQDGPVPRCASPHTVLFADRSEALSLEVDAAGWAVRGLADGFDYLVQTNHFLNPRMKRREMEFPLEREYTIGRFRLLRDAVEENFGRIDVQRLVDIISCNVDRLSGTTRLLGDFPAQANTLSSVIFEPETGNFWVAAGRPPAVCYNRYRGFNFFAETGTGKGARDRPGRRLPSYIRSSSPVLRGTQFRPIGAKARKSLHNLILSQEQLKQGKLRAAVKAVQRAASLQADPGIEYLRAILYLMTGEAEEALRLFRFLEQTTPFPPVKTQALLLWEGRCLDSLDRRAEAEACYRRALDSPAVVEELRTVLRRSLRRPFRPAELPDTLEYYLLGPLSFA